MFNKNTLEFNGCAYFRQRLALSLLSGKPIIINRIRCDSESIGCLPYEVDLLRFIEKLTNGTKVSINKSGTTVSFVPGVLIGGTVSHTCDSEQSPSYYIEFSLMIAPFCKCSLNISFTGDYPKLSTCPSIERLQRSVAKMIPKFIEQNTDVIIKRLDDKVVFECSRVNQLKPCGLWIDPGKVKRIRGVAYRLGRIPASTLSRMIDCIKKVLLDILPDVYIVCDSRPSKEPVYGLCLVAESTDPNCCYTSEVTSESVTNRQLDKYVTPDLVAEEALTKLLKEIYCGGVVDSVSQPLALLYMACNQPDLSKVNVGRLSKTSVEMLRNLNRFFNLKFRLSEENNAVDADDDTFLTGSPTRTILSCFGVGYRNIFKNLT
ncbi:hypothetical protein GJ496_009103 [Pomphorhynchus laevis]|nr:hypothetical protein GJ496_009318 [Pomphorhynchus laevis]KAI0989048.1 hypothetical protein GJ496_009103 [Pomphorhynchus laevis]